MKTTITVRSRFLAATLICFLILTSACALNPKASGTPTIPQTALQWTIIYNAAVAKADRAVEQSVETLQTAGVITVAQARPVIVACGKVATTSEGVRGITSTSTEAKWSIDGPKIRALLAATPLTVPVAQNQTIDLAVAAVNAAITLLTQAVQ